MLPSRRSFASLMVALFAVAVLAAACGAGDEASSGAEDGGAPRDEAVPGEATGVPEEAPADDGGDGEGIAFGQIPVQGPSIVKIADLEVLVKRDGFEAAFNEATVVATRYGGFVFSSRTSGSGSRSGTITIRVPAASFESAMTDLRRMGKVTDEMVSGEDVSAQFVDLEARLRTWEAQEAVLLKLMDDAGTIEETLTVQRHLQDVQLRIEQISGELRALRDRTDLSTITVTIREQGAPPPKPSTGVDQPSLGKAWDEARAGFLKVIAGVVVVLGYLVPLGLFLLVALLLWRRFRPDVLPAGPARPAAGMMPPPPDAVR